MSIPNEHAAYIMKLVKELALRIDLDNWVGDYVYLNDLIIEIITDYELMVAYDIKNGAVPEGFREWELGEENVED